MTLALDARQLIDFGMSARFQEGMPMNERVGTVYTMAPEVLQGEYTKQVLLVLVLFGLCRFTEKSSGPFTLFTFTFTLSPTSNFKRIFLTQALRFTGNLLALGFFLPSC